MAKPLGGSPIKDSDFKFLTSPSVGRGGLSLSTEEARRFVQNGKTTICMCKLEEKSGQRCP